jgi:RHS repeat-associated protein
LTPQAVPGLTGVTQLAVGAAHDGALKGTTLKDWGANANGQLGDGTTTVRTSPQTASAFTAGADLGVRFGYDGDGLRASKTVDGTRKDFSWDVSSGLPLLLSDAAASYIYGPDGLPLEQVSSAGTATFYHHDQLGSTRLLTDSTGAAVASFSFDAYGNPAGSTGTQTTPFGFAGEYTDAETGLQYLRARYYDPQTAQFLTRDPLGLGGGDSNLYGYVGRDPVDAADPSGLAPTPGDHFGGPLEGLNGDEPPGGLPSRYPSQGYDQHGEPFPKVRVQPAGKLKPCPENNPDYRTDRQLDPHQHDQKVLNELDKESHTDPASTIAVDNGVKGFDLFVNVLKSLAQALTHGPGGGGRPHAGPGH